MFWGAGCEPNTDGDRGPVSPEKEAHVPRVPQATWQRAGKGSSFTGRSRQQFPAPVPSATPAFPPGSEE